MCPSTKHIQVLGVFLIGSWSPQHTIFLTPRMGALLSGPDFVFEVWEHMAFCFSCIGPTLPPEEQAAMLLREVPGFMDCEAAMVEASEPVCRLPI